MNERPSFTNLNQANTEINNIQNNITNSMNNVLNGDFSKATEQLNNINTQYNNLVNDLKNNNLYDNLQEKISKTNQMLDDFKNKTEQGLKAQKKSVSDMAESLPQILTVFRQIQETVDNISGKLNDANNTSISKFKNEVDNIKQLFDSLLETPLLDETKVQQSAKKISETYSDSLKSAFSMADIGKDLILESVKNNQNEIANEIKKILLDTSTTISNMSTNVATNIGSSSDSIGSMDAITFNRLITDILANKLEESNKNVTDKILDKLNFLLEKVNNNADVNDKNYLESLKGSLSNFLEFEKQSKETVERINNEPDKKGLLLEELKDTVSKMVMSAQSISSITSTDKNGQFKDINNDVLSRVQNYDSSLDSVSEIKELLDKLININDNKGFILINDKNAENVNLINLGMDEFLNKMTSSDISGNMFHALELIDMNSIISKKMADLNLASLFTNSEYTNTEDDDFLNKAKNINFSSVFGPLEHPSFGKIKFNESIYSSNKLSAQKGFEKSYNDLDNAQERYSKAFLTKEEYKNAKTIKRSNLNIPDIKEKLFNIQAKAEEKKESEKLLNSFVSEYEKLHRQYDKKNTDSEKAEIREKLLEKQMQIEKALNELSVIQTDLLKMLETSQFDTLKDVATFTEDEDLLSAIKGINTNTYKMFISSEALLNLIELLGDTNSNYYDDLKKAVDSTSETISNGFLSESKYSKAVALAGGEGGGGGISNTIKYLGNEFIKGLNYARLTAQKLLDVNLTLWGIISDSINYYKEFAKMDVKSAKAQLQQGYSVDEDILKENRRKGIDYFRDTYGFVNYDEYANMSSGLIGGVQGHYGGDKSSGKKDMQGMTESALLWDKVYDIDSKSIIGTLYKELGKSASETESFIYKLISSAQASNVPVSQYVKTMEELGKTFKNLGIDIGNAEGAMARLTESGMSINVARQTVSDFGNAINSFGNNWGEAAFYGVMSGQYSDPFKAGWEAVDRWDANGNVKAGAAEKVANSYATELSLYRNLGSDDVGKTLMKNNLMSHGFNLQDAVTMVNKLGKGDMTGFAEMFTEKSEELDKETVILEGKEDLQEKLKLIADKTDGFTKAATEVKVTEMEIVNTNKELVDLFGSGLQKIFSTLGGVIISASNLVAKAVGKLSKLLEFGADHPIMVILLAIAAKLGARTLGKKALKYGVKYGSKFLKYGGKFLKSGLSKLIKSGAIKIAAKKLIPGLVKATPGIGAVISGGFEIYDGVKAGNDPYYTTTMVAGTGGGAFLGGVIGSAAGPLGTLAGAAIGSAVGHQVGKFTNKYIGGINPDGTPNKNSLASWFVRTFNIKDGFHNTGENTEESATKEEYQNNKISNSKQTILLANKSQNMQSKSYDSINNDQKTTLQKLDDIGRKMKEANGNQEAIKDALYELDEVIKNKDFGSSNSSSSSSSSSADTKFGGSSNKVTLDAGDYKDIIEAASKKYGISADIIAAVMQAESSGDAKAYNSKSKATGLMQIIPDTAKFIAEKQGRSSYDLYDPETNIDMSTWYMRYLIDTYKYNKAPTEQGKYADMLAAYNWGPGNYEKSGLHGNVEAGDYEKLNSETKDYVTKIIGAVYGDKAKIMESNDDYKKKNETEEEDNSTNDNSISTSTSTSSSSNTDLSSSSNSSDSYSEPSSSGGFGNFSQDQISKLQAAPIYKNGSAEYSNQTTQYDPTKYSGYDPVEGNVKIDYQGFARQTATSLYNSMNLDKYAKEIAENAQKVNSADRNRQKFEININANGSDPTTKEYIKNIQSSVDNLTQQYYGYSDAMSVTVKTTNDSEY